GPRRKRSPVHTRQWRRPAPARERPPAPTGCRPRKPPRRRPPIRPRASSSARRAVATPPRLRGTGSRARWRLNGPPPGGWAAPRRCRSRWCRRLLLVAAEIDVEQGGFALFFLIDAVAFDLGLSRFEFLLVGVLVGHVELLSRLTQRRESVAGTSGLTSGNPSNPRADVH